MEKIQLRFPGNALNACPALPASKSESNRALMMRAYSGGKVEIENLSGARDTAILASLLEEDPDVYDAQDAGTTLRFLSTYLALKGENRMLTGSERMKQRPVGILVRKLNELGARISYEEKEGYPPLRFGKGHFEYKPVETDIEPEQSSQFISSLLLAAPVFCRGMRLRLNGERVVSRPYIQMSLAMMEKAGISCRMEGNIISIDPGPYQPCRISIEPDWSSAGYWLAMLTLAKPGSMVKFDRLSRASLQGDAAMAGAFEALGLTFETEGNGLRVCRPDKLRLPELLQMDFSDMPDQGQTWIALCAGLGLPFSFTGLETLALKETNRLAAMKSELFKFGIHLKINEEKGFCQMDAGRKAIQPSQCIDTCRDHRMAMSLAPLSMLFDGGIAIADPGVVDKSYPGFWEEMRKAGFAAG